MQHRYIFITYLPGAAGNFMGRCLQLLRGYRVFVDQNNSMPKDTMEKLKILDYTRVENYGKLPKLINWLAWEMNLKIYQSINPHNSLLDGETGVFITHPQVSEWYHQYVAKDDIFFSFYMDEIDVYDWVMVNSAHKDSFQSEQWFRLGKKIAQDPSVFKINLKNIINDLDGFFVEIEKICKIIGYQLDDVEKIALKQLYVNWKTTMIDYPEVEQYKQALIDALTDEYNEKINWLTKKE